MQEVILTAFLGFKNTLSFDHDLRPFVLFRLPLHHLCSFGSRKKLSQQIPTCPRSVAQDVCFVHDADAPNGGS